MKVTIAICTYNRSFYLDKCLNGLSGQLSNMDSTINVLIVDNNSTDNTHDIFVKYEKLGWPISYVKELKQGLSHARNCAIENCQTPYLGYLDDDAIPHSNYIERLISIIDEHEPDCFGGMYYPYYENEKPKWIPNSFGQKSKLSSKFSLIKDKYLSGGIMFCKLAIMKEVGGFDPSRGMIGNKIGYAEEDHFQMLLRSAGYSIYFDPSLAMNHLVPVYKQKMLWHIKKTYKSSYNTVDPVYEKYNTWYSIKSVGRIFLYKTPRLFKMLSKDKNYFIQSLIVDFASSFARILGLYFNRNK
ncbi:glycosyltransferase family 2 protein [Nonlabens sp. Asnod3-H03]|uniref:Probable glycosyl transferase n=1 Tax=Nonlabens ulvanivorans TaxID=906888 RepID=A0A081DER7_NONUL|nr:glycosyltransferase family 2 protein [Nonlabens ulvanivorans]GAK77413.1 probable glycosyl transferase [Nonlabens ulvanivorans]